MSITANQLKEIKQELARMKPAAVTLNGNRAMTVKQAIFALAPTLERMKKHGFDTQEIIEKLHEKGIEVKAQTLTKYRTEARRQREGRKVQKKDTAPPAAATAKAPTLPAETARDNDTYSSLLTPDIPLDQL